MRGGYWRMARLLVLGSFLLVPLVMGPGGCIPAFEGLKPVSKKELHPPKGKKPLPPAEILFVEEYRKQRPGQIGQARNTTFIRVYQRIRINDRKGFKYATKTLRGDKLLTLQVRTSCPDGRTATLDLEGLQQKTKESKSASSFYGLWQRSSNLYKFTAPGVDEGCVIDFYWEIDKRADTDRLNIYLMKWEMPLRRAHYHLEYLPGYFYRTYFWNMGSLEMRLGKQMMQMARLRKKKGGKAKATSGPVNKEKQNIRLIHDEDARTFDLWLRDIPPKIKPRKFERKIRKLLLPSDYRRTPLCQFELVRTQGLEVRNYLMAWKNIDAQFTRPGSVLTENRTRYQRSYQMDEEEELHSEHLPAIAKKVVAKTPGRHGKIWKLYHHLRRRMLVSRKGAFSSRNKLWKIYRFMRGSDYEINMIYVVMLRSIGIRAYPVLVPSGYWKDYHKSEPQWAFRYMRVYIAPKSEGPWRGLEKERAAARRFLSQKGDKYEGGRLVKKGGRVANPSDKVLPFGRLKTMEQGVMAYIIDGAGGRFYRTSVWAQKHNKIKAKLKAKLQPDGTIRGLLRFQFYGSEAYHRRSRFRSQPPHRWEKKFVGGTIRKACGAHTEYKFVDRPKLDLEKLREPFGYSYRFKGEYCLGHGKNKVVLNPLPEWMFDVPMLGEKTRLAPIYLGSPRTWTFQLSYQFPKGFRLAEKFPAHKKFVAPGIEAECSFKKGGDSLQVTFQIRYKKRLLPATEYKKVQQFYRKLKKMIRRRVVVAKGGEVTPAPRVTPPPRREPETRPEPKEEAKKGKEEPKKEGKARKGKAKKKKGKKGKASEKAKAKKKEGKARKGQKAKKSKARPRPKARKEK